MLKYVERQRKVTPVGAIAVTERSRSSTLDPLPLGADFLPFEGVDLSGNAYAMDAKPEDLILLDFWYLACSPCMKAMPEMAALFNKYKKGGNTTATLCIKH